MKKLLLINFLLFSFVLSHGVDRSNFYLEDGSLVYVKVFEMDGYNEYELRQLLGVTLPTVEGIGKYFYNGLFYTGRFHMPEIPRNRYRGSSWGAIRQPFVGNYTLEVRDNRYRLVVSDIVFLTNRQPTLLNEAATRRNGQYLTRKRRVLNGLDLMDQFFTDKFGVSHRVMASDW